MNQMQRTRGKRCQVPIRTRRRQSDAKWRASVASCYETLKFVIPNGKTLPKRKASKSLILQETEKHIENLERAVSRLLNIEAHDQGQGVLWRREETWCPATLEDFQKDFAKQQRHIFHQSSQGRRCYNMLHDIQEDIINMKVNCNHLAFLPLGSPPALKTDATRDATTCTRRHKVSKARCRYETERASQRILSAYNTGDLVNAVIPSPTPSATTTTATTAPITSEHPHSVPTTPQSALASSLRSGLYNGTTLRLQKVDNAFVSVDHLYRREPELVDHHHHHHHHLYGREPEELPPFQQGMTPEHADRPVGLKRQPADREHRVQTVHEVPIMMTPNKVYGIARNDVMMSQEGEVPDMFTPAAPPTCSSSSSSSSSSTCVVPPAHRLLIKREVDADRPPPFYSSVCKKLDFSTTPERMYENSGFQMTDNIPYFASLVCSASTGFTPIKTEISSATGLTPVKQETVRMTESGGGSTGTPVLMTPLKLSSDLGMADTALFSPSSAWALGTAMDARVPQAAGLSDLEELPEMDDDHGLLCMETFDLDHDDTDTIRRQKTPQTVSTPSKHKHDCKKRTTCKKRSHTGLKAGGRHSCSHRPSPHCKKRLEGLYEKFPTQGSKDTNPCQLNIDHYDNSSECSEFDGYLLYYQQIAPALKKKLGTSHDANSLAAIVSDMWSKLPRDDRNTMVTLAALENQDSNSSCGSSLSQDLEELNVTPIHDKQLAC